jgi:hypothetical protein
MATGLMDIVWIVLALGILGTVIWAFQAYVTIPGPFSWLKGLMTFVIILVACVFVWQTFVAGHFRHPLR